MHQSKVKSTLKHFLQALSKVLLFVAALSFFFGGRAIHEFASVERLFAEVIGIGIAVVCVFGGFIAKRAIEDLEWEEENEEALGEQSKPTEGQN